MCRHFFRFFLTLLIIFFVLIGLHVLLRTLEACVLKAISPFRSSKISSTNLTPAKNLVIKNPEKDILSKKPIAIKSTTSSYISENSIIITGVRYLTLEEIIKSLKLKIVSDTKKGQVSLTKAGVKIQLVSGQDFITYQQSKIFLTHKLIFQNNNLLIGYEDYLKIFVPLLASNLIKEKIISSKEITIDAGHGGGDSGARNPSLGLYEKNITSALAKLLKEELSKAGYAYRMTREMDVSVSLKDRSLKSKGSGILISIHANAAPNKMAHGIEVYVLGKTGIFGENAFDSCNILVGYCVLSALAKSTNLENRGLKKADFFILKSPLPSILIEVGFISNDSEGKKLADPDFQNKIVQGIFNGIKNYFAVIDQLVKNR